MSLASPLGYYYFFSDFFASARRTRVSVSYPHYFARAMNQSVGKGGKVRTSSLLSAHDSRRVLLRLGEFRAGHL